MKGAQKGIKVTLTRINGFFLTAFFFGQKKAKRTAPPFALLCIYSLPPSAPTGHLPLGGGRQIMVKSSPLRDEGEFPLFMPSPTEGRDKGRG